MAEIKEFIVNDRRKFTAEGDLRPDAPPSEPKQARPETLLQPTSDDHFGSSARLVDTPAPQPVATPEPPADDDPNQPPPLTADQISQATRAYEATVTRLDTALRAANPGAEPMPQMTFERVIQSLYMQALLQLGGAAEPGQQPQVDILGARQTIDMLAIIDRKTTKNLTEGEEQLMANALFELRMGFLEVTQALARQATTRQQPPPPSPGGPKIVR